ncbi:hypothetical protein Aoki45_12330 [Algoriphagus sp. oki45]|uniref:outer membrane beta-barrel protein n=1 Tax=Algoriphagus sp. oki45 TaxID=3067294 RepID=UPI0027F6DB13|nr:hypothetical protein Aoki45_12330 [Algoriphagus sp. oki45]
MGKVLFVVCFMSLSILVFAQELDSNNINQKERNFDFGVRIGGSASFLSFDKSGLFEVSENAKFGGSFGFRLDWKITDYNKIRVEPYYLFQQFENRFENEDVQILSEFQTHGFGVDVLPIVLQVGGRVKPTLELGGYFNYLFSTSENHQVNSNFIDFSIEGKDPVQYGILAGFGISVNRKLFVLRVYQPLSDFVSDINQQNYINRISLIVGL